MKWNVKKVNQVISDGFLPHQLGRSYFADSTETKKCSKCGDFDEMPADEDVCDSCHRAIEDGWEF